MRNLSFSRRTALTGGLATLLIGPALGAEIVTIIKTLDGRNVRISVWPAKGHQRGVIAFSHGYFSSPWKYDLILSAWAKSGFTVFAPLHVDSGEYPERAKYPQAASWRLRLEDMQALSRFIDTKNYIAAGHSYGALVALTLGGASAIAPAGFTGALRDKRAVAVVALSPPGPTPTLITKEGFATLAVPALVQSGDRDVPFGATDGRWQVHLTGYDQAPPGKKYALVLKGVDHYFGGLICEFDKPGPPQTAQLADAITRSTQFIAAYGAHDAAARAMLNTPVSDGFEQLTRK